MNYLIVTNRVWYNKLPKMLSECYKSDNFFLIDNKADFTYEKIDPLKPKYIFLPHWSYIVPADIYNNFECVIFHMTEVPFGRGGSPLQNLIANGIYDTKISALKCIKELDAGPIYIKERLSLYGAAEEIYMRAATVIQKMILKIMANNPVPVKQEGQVVCFKRRKVEDGNVEKIQDIQQLFDYIRMLDADGYPRAFLETDYFKLEFERATLKNECIISDVKITRKSENHE